MSAVSVPIWLLSSLILVAAAVALAVQRSQNEVFPREWGGYLAAYLCWGSMGLLGAVTDASWARIVIGVGVGVGYVVFAYAIVWFHRTRVVGIDRDWMLDATVVSTAIAILLWTNLEVTRTASEQLPPVEQAVFAVAALIHVSFLTLTARLLVITGWRAIRPYVGTSAGVVSAAGSAVYFVAQASGTEVPVAAYALWALGAIALASIPLWPPARYFRDDLGTQQRPFARFAMLATALLVGTGAVLWNRAPSVSETVPTGGVVLLSLLVLWRMHGLVATNEERKWHLEKLAAQQATLAELGRSSLERTDVATFKAWATDRIRAALRVDRCTVVDIDRELLPDVDGPAGGRTNAVTARIAGTDGSYGVLVVSVDVPRTFSADEREFVSGAADVLAVAIDRIVREDTIRHASLHDPLTGLPNRTLLFDRLDHALAGMARRYGEVALLFIDLDCFKGVNDRLGHVGGDELLVEVARRLRSVARASDTLSRFGGDEFVLLAEEVPDEAAAVSIGERISAALRDPVVINGTPVTVSASVGIATAGTGEGMEALLHRADAAMYRAKELGRARVEVAAAATSGTR